jgi:hypothetical protein
MGLKTFQECVRLQTFNRSGYNQIQLDVQYLRGALRDKMLDEAVLDSLLDEVSSVCSCETFWVVLHYKASSLSLKVMTKLRNK